MGAITCAQGICIVFSSSSQAFYLLYKQEMKAYRDMTFENPYSQNVYADMGNKFEDLTVNQQQADFLAQQNQQSQANILDAIRSGGDFNVGNIQALANQSQIANQQASVSIGQQESANQRMAAQEESKLQPLSDAANGMLEALSGAATASNVTASSSARGWPRGTTMQRFHR